MRVEIADLAAAIDPVSDLQAQFYELSKAFGDPVEQASGDPTEQN